MPIYEVKYKKKTKQYFVESPDEALELGRIYFQTLDVDVGRYESKEHRTRNGRVIRKPIEEER